MNRQQLYTLSGVLLASTAASGVAGVAYAGTVAVATSGATVAPLATSTSAVKIANTIFSTTATTADAVVVNTTGGKSFAILFTNAFTNNTKFSVEIDVSGAQFNTTSPGTTKILLRDPSQGMGTIAATIAATGNCTSITPLVGKLILDGCQVSNSNFATGTTGAGTNSSWAAGGLVLSGVTFNTANSLATVGNSIALSGSVYNSNNTSQTFESITSGNIITSQAPIAATVTACTPVVANPTATPAAFDYLNSGSNIGNGSLILTMCLATVAISQTGALSATLTGPVDMTSSATSVNVIITDTVLSSAAVSSLLVAPSGGGAASVTMTTAAFSGGVATFSIGSFAAGITTASNFSINLTFTGTTPIPAAAAGTISVAFGKGGAASAQAAATATGSGAQITRGGFNGELNTFLASSNTSFTSFARIHNMGATSGAASITVLNDATGAQLGSTFNTATVAAGQTLQLSNKDIETAAGITAASGVNYTIQITGPFIGYAQHIIFNPATGQLADLSGFRNHDAGSGNSP